MPYLPCSKRNGPAFSFSSSLEWMTFLLSIRLRPEVVEPFMAGRQLHMGGSLPRRLQPRATQCTGTNSSCSCWWVQQRGGLVQVIALLLLKYVPVKSMLRLAAACGS